MLLLLRTSLTISKEFLNPFLKKETYKKKKTILSFPHDISRKTFLCIFMSFLLNIVTKSSFMERIFMNAIYHSILQLI